MKPFVLLALVIFIAAGCGGGSSTGPVYSIAKTKKCLETLGIHNFPPLGDDFVASTASNGALRARLPDNAVTILFGQSADEANNLADAYRRFRAKNVGIEDVLRVKNNAVLLWQLHPPAQEESNVSDCVT